MAQVDERAAERDERVAEAGAVAERDAARPSGPPRGLRAKIAAATVDNPVLVKEFRSRMRGARAYWILFGYTLLIATILGFTYWIHEGSVDRSQGYIETARAAQGLGRTMYFIVFITQALMMTLITPAITSGAVTLEREQRSYELLVTTPLQPVDLIRGKLAAAVSFVLLLLTASLPLVSLTFLVGGVSPAEIFFSYLLIALSAFVYGALGIFWSSALKSTAAATVVTYISVMGLVLTTLFPGMMAMDNSGTGTGANPHIPFQSLNPIIATFRNVQPEYVFAAEIPSWLSAATLLFLLGTLVSILAMGRLEHFDPPRPLWPRLCATLLWVAFGLALLGPVLGNSFNGLRGTSPAGEIAAAALLSILVLVALITPIWNTGDLIVRRGESILGRYLSGFLPHRMLQNDLSSGLPLTLLWVVLMVGMIPLGAFTFGKLGLPGLWEVLVPGALVIAAMAFGFAGVGNLLSVTVPSRWAACILTYLAMVVCMLLPYFVLSPWTQQPGTQASAWGVLIYLVPFEGVAELVSKNSFWSSQMQLPVRPIWIITTVLYTGLGVVCFIATAARVRRVGQRLQSRMAATDAALQAA